ncbi:MAG: magnesium/cobalt transporter CorA [Nanoarchaeota archaeon]|nr:magnesium/cobalt transporter CorA [Nanoarchaeota archaeon]
MSKFIKKSSQKAGMMPGSVVHIGRQKVDKPIFELIDYTLKDFREMKLKTVEEAFPFKDKPSVTWLDITGLHKTDIIETVCNHFGIHPLIQEDIVNTGQRPTIEDSEDYMFIVLKMLSYDKNGLSSEQVSIILGSNFVLSFQEREGDVFDSVRERIKGSKWKIRKLGSDYLAYALIDSIIDNYFIVLEKIADKLENLETEFNSNPSQKTLNEAYNIKKELIFLRKSVWPLREVISKFHKSESKLIQKQTPMYISDLYDHTIQVIDTIESFRDTISSMVDLHLSTVSNKMNEIMKVLTIFAAIFIPLTFVAGIYGMNFDFMPELSWRLGYLFAWLIFAGVGIGMLIYFRIKKWI